MKIRIASVLNVRGADARVAHNGASAAGLDAGGRVVITAIILRMACPELVADFVGYVIHVKGVALRLLVGRSPPGRLTRRTGATKKSNAVLAGSSEYVSNVVITRAK